MITHESIVIRPTGRLCHDEAERLASVAALSKAKTVIIDMTRVSEATTPGLARLVLARRALLESNRDVRIAGLQGQPARLLEVHRLQDVLPLIHRIPAEAIPADREDPSPRPRKSNPLDSCWTGFEQICYA